MALKDFDRIVQIVEDNITLDIGHIEEMVCNKFVLLKRQAAEFFKSIDPEQRTLKQYIRERRNLRALEEYASGKTKEKVCEQYNLDEVNFYRAVKLKYPDKTFPDFRDEGYSCPDPVSLEEVINSEGIRVEEKPLQNEDKRKYIAEIKRLIDENNTIKSQLDRERIDSLRTLKEVPDETNITYDAYERFLEIEDLRVTFGFSVREILMIYEEWLELEKGISLEEFCDTKYASYFFEWEKEQGRSESSYHYSPEYEMDVGEAYSYHFGDDDPADMPDDPYAPTEDDRLRDKEYFEEEYERELEFEEMRECGCEEDDEWDNDLTEEQEREIDEMLKQMDLEKQEIVREIVDQLQCSDIQQVKSIRNKIRDIKKLEETHEKHPEESGDDEIWF